ncbi:Peroxidase 52 [Capsicum annuum]|uniref:peroxidase n=1 Tax=Capsicum annuum TaxID=4072 RepID=A0A2G2ZBG6_CAPAN|nr:Peroxidase 52 [Capsicum annuum]
MRCSITLASEHDSSQELSNNKLCPMGKSLHCYIVSCFIRCAITLVLEGCDGSLFLDDTSTFTGKKRAQPNFNPARGFEVIDDIKSAVKKVCPGVVSCADILAVTARDSFAILGGPNWDVKLGRRDARTASQAPANNSIPTLTSNLNRLISSFNAVGLSTKDMIVLSRLFLSL